MGFMRIWFLVLPTTHFGHELAVVVAAEDEPHVGPSHAQRSVQDEAVGDCLARMTGEGNKRRVFTRARLDSDQRRILKPVLTTGQKDRVETSRVGPWA